MHFLHKPQKSLIYGKNPAQMRAQAHAQNPRKTRKMRTLRAQNPAHCAPLPAHWKISAPWEAVGSRGKFSNGAKKPVPTGKISISCAPSSAYLRLNKPHGTYVRIPRPEELITQLITQLIIELIIKLIIICIIQLIIELITGLITPPARA